MPYTSYRMQMGSAPWHKWVIRPKLSVPPTSFFCKARETCIGSGINGKKCGNSPHWWNLFVSFPLTCRFRDLQSPVNIHHMKAIWFGGRSRTSDLFLQNTFAFITACIFPEIRISKGKSSKPSPQWQSEDICGIQDGHCP